MKTAFVIFDRLTAMDFIGAYDPLTRLRSMQLMPGFEWDVCAFAAGIADDKGLRITPNRAMDSDARQALVALASARHRGR